jgi:hypothetical protein
MGAGKVADGAVRRTGNPRREVAAFRVPSWRCVLAGLEVAMFLAGMILDFVGVAAGPLRWAGARS